MRNLICLILSFAPLCLAWAENEDKWIETTFQLPLLNSPLEGYTTDSGSFRMKHVPESSSEIIISGKRIERPLSRGISTCNNYGNYLRIVKVNEKNTYKFKSSAYPLAKETLRRLDLNIENLPRLNYVDVILMIPQGGLVTPDSASSFESKSSDYLKTQIPKIIENGEIQFELDRVDDVACALLTGQAKLEIHFGVEYQNAKHTRTKNISANEFEKIYESIKVKPSVDSANLVKFMVNGARLEKALKEVTGKGVDEFGAENFLLISKSIYRSDNGNLLNISPGSYEKASRATDLVQLKMGFQVQKSSLTPNVEDK